MSDELRLTGKTALVTGASRGIGRAIALAYGRAGADVAVLARTTDELKTLADELAQLGRKSLVLTCDVGDRGQVKAAVAAAIGEFGSLEILVNNAGGAHHAGPFLELTDEDWAEVWRTNVQSVVYFCREAGRHMVSRGTGSIINVSSIAGTTALPMMSHYSATKFAVTGITRTLGAEWASAGVRVNALAPGFVTTTLTASFVAHQEFSDGLIKQVPSHRWGDPEDMTGAAVFLASDAARWINGTTLVVDGGLTSYFCEPALGLLDQRTPLTTASR